MNVIEKVMKKLGFHDFPYFPTSAGKFEMYPQSYVQADTSSLGQRVFVMFVSETPHFCSRGMRGDSYAGSCWPPT